MDLEKIISIVLNKVGNTDVSAQTIKTLISLKPVPDGQEPDDTYFNEIVDAVKSVQGNVNNVFSAKLAAQVNSKVEEYKKEHSARKEQEDKPATSDDRLKKLEEELSELRAERQKEQTERERKDLFNSVKKSLEDKFRTAGNTANPFFVETALAKLSIPEKGADVKSLTDEAERLYNADLKKAGFDPDFPRAGSGSAVGVEKIDGHEFDDVAKIVGRNRPQTAN